MRIAIPKPTVHSPEEWDAILTAMEQKRDPANGLFLCSPEQPMPKGAEIIRWAHTNVVEVGEQEDGYPGGDLVTYKCKDCGQTWESELPQ